MNKPTMKVKPNISEYKASNIKALSYLLLPFALAVSGLIFTLHGNLYVHMAGQLVLSVFFAQAFILLHECGHLNFFKTRLLNIVFGNLFGFLAMIPFYTWQHMHNLHHRWTGWRDKDPTTEKTVEPSTSPVMRVVANVAWLLFIPVFYLAYKISNYWNLLKIKRFINTQHYKKSVLIVLVYLSAYGLLGILFWDFISENILPAFLLSLIWKELIILTQHSHVDIPISYGKEVRPVPFKDQIPFTRSFYTFRIVEEYFLFNFNFHEAHHVYPGLPAYWLSSIDIGVPKKPNYFDWFKQAKSLKGEDYIFRTSKDTGKIF